MDAAYRANFDLPQIPEPDGSYMLNQKCDTYIKKKRGNLYLLPVPLSEALALPITVWTSNAEAHADMYNLNTSLTHKDETRDIKTYRVDTHCCFALTVIEICEISESQEQNAK